MPMPEWAKYASMGGMVGGQAMNLFGGSPDLDYQVPDRLPPDMLTQWRRYNRLVNQGSLAGQRQDIRGNAARMGLGNTGFINNMEAPAWQQFGQNELQGEAQISDAEMRAYLEFERMKMQQDMEKARLESEQGGFGDLISGAAGMLPFMFL